MSEPKFPLNAVKPDGAYLVVNNWQCVTKEEALLAVYEARKRSDQGVHAVQFSHAVYAPEMFRRLEAIAGSGSPHGASCECEQCENFDAVLRLLEKIEGGGK